MGLCGQCVCGTTETRSWLQTLVSCAASNAAQIGCHAGLAPLKTMGPVTNYVADQFCRLTGTV